MDLLAAWPDPARAVIGVTDADATRLTEGDVDRLARVASITKLFTAMAILVAVEEGSVELDEPAGPEGSTLRHLLAHAAGYGFDGADPILPPERRRTYSNTGIEVAADHVAARTGMAFPIYLTEAVVQPLGLERTELRGSPATGLRSTVRDLLTFARELLAPTLIHRSTLAEATTVQFPGLSGVIPGLGRYEPNDWGLGFEIRGRKSPHWTGAKNSAATFGHFGGSGTFLWVDPVLGLACAAMSATDFGPWVLDVWPPTSNEVIERLTDEG